MQKIITLIEGYGIVTFFTYAQNFEDVRLWRALNNVTNGQYLDIGAQDPIIDSVSLAFYEKGWRGLHVEPTPAYAAAVRAARPDEIVVEAAVSTQDGPICLFEFPNTGLSTSDPLIAKRHKNERKLQAVPIEVPTISLSKLFDIIGDGPIHWMKIDVEGMERDVLESWNGHHQRPWIIVIEATLPNTRIKSHEDWINIIIKKGYKDVHFDGLSRYFVSENHDHLTEALIEDPNIFDDFQISENHFSARALMEKYHHFTTELQDHEALIVADLEKKIEISRMIHERSIKEFREIQELTKRYFFNNGDYRCLEELNLIYRNYVHDVIDGIENYWKSNFFDYLD